MSIVDTPSAAAESAAAHIAPPKKRLAALDQFRGYTMAGMFLVNFIGSFGAVHDIFKHHHTYCSYADTIMPGFFFAVGFAFRLTYQQRVREHGNVGAIRHALWRNLKLMFIGFLAYNIGNFIDLWHKLGTPEAGPTLWNILVNESFQALVLIAFTSLWVLPVIGFSSRVRWGYLLFSAALHSINCYFFYYAYAHDHVIDGGPLGIIGWAVPTLLGTLVCDAVRENRDPAAQWKRLTPWAIGFMVVGYALACLNLLHAPADAVHTGLARFLVEPPFLPPTRPVDMWTMDQQTASTSYMVFSAGFSVAVYLFFVLVSDRWGYQVGVFRTLGKNPLFGYLYHGVIGAIVSGFIAGDAPLAKVILAFVIYFTITWATLRYLEYKEWYWKL